MIWFLARYCNNEMKKKRWNRSICKFCGHITHKLPVYRKHCLLITQLCSRLYSNSCWTQCALNCHECSLFPMLFFCLFYHRHQYLKLTSCHHSILICFPNAAMSKSRKLTSKREKKADNVAKTEMREICWYKTKARMISPEKKM